MKNEGGKLGISFFFFVFNIHNHHHQQFHLTRLSNLLVLPARSDKYCKINIEWSYTTMETAFTHSFFSLILQISDEPAPTLCFISSQFNRTGKKLYKFTRNWKWRKSGISIRARQNLVISILLLFFFVSSNFSFSFEFILRLLSSS